MYIADTDPLRVYRTLESVSLAVTGLGNLTDGLRTADAATSHAGT